MFEYLEPDAAGASNQPPAQTGRAHPHPERVRHLFYGSLAALDRTIKILHAYGYADPSDGRDPIPVPSNTVETASPSRAHRSSSGVGTWMVILTKTLLIE